MTKIVRAIGPNEKGMFQSNSNLCPGHDEQFAEIMARIRAEEKKQKIKK